MKVLVCGSRDFPEWGFVDHAIDRRIRHLPLGTVVIHGGARGVDTRAGIVAQFHGYAVQVFPADWETHGRSAGVIRNLAMLDERPDLVIAWWDGASKGTVHTIREAQKRGIPVEVIRV